MLYPLSHWRISVSLNIIAGFSEFVKSKVKKFLRFPQRDRLWKHSCNSANWNLEGHWSAHIEQRSYSNLTCT